MTKFRLATQEELKGLKVDATTIRKLFDETKSPVNTETVTRGNSRAVTLEFPNGEKYVVKDVYTDNVDERTWPATTQVCHSLLIQDKDGVRVDDETIKRECKEEILDPKKSFCVEGETDLDCRNVYTIPSFDISLAKKDKVVYVGDINGDGRLDIVLKIVAPSDNPEYSNVGFLVYLNVNDSAK